jgi:transposase
MPFHAGLDWGGASHAVCIVDGTDRIVGRLDVRQDANGLADMAARLKRIATPAELPIAIERPSGLIPGTSPGTDALLAARHPVIPIHPNVVKAGRPRYRAAGGKSDADDAYMLADILRTDGHRFRPLTAASDEIKALSALGRGRGDLVAQRVALANQLRSLLEGFWPGAAAIFSTIDSQIALAFIGRYPTPNSASRLGEKRLASFLAQHAYSGRYSAAELLARLRAAPTGLAGDAEVEAKGEIVSALVVVLGRLVAKIARVSSRIEHAVADAAAGRIVMSFPRAGRINAAQILAELGDVRERFPTEDQLAAEAGVCPVTHASGKSRGVVFRWACNKNPRLALTRFADNSRHACTWAWSSIRKPVSVDASTRMPSASSRVPGSGSCGVPGRTESHTTRASIALPQASHDPGSVPWFGCSARSFVPARQTSGGAA